MMTTGERDSVILCFRGQIKIPLLGEGLTGSVEDGVAGWIKAYRSAPCTAVSLWEGLLDAWRRGGALF